MSETRKPMLLFIAGPNGSGKSTIAEYFDLVGEYTNADQLVRVTGISDYDAAKEVDARRYRAINEKRDLSFETVLSSNYKMNILRTAKKEGYFLKGVFVLTTNPVINLARIKSRVALGGHDVSSEKVVSRYWKSLAHINELLELCDILHVYDNSQKNPVRIIRKHKDELSIYPNKLWDRESIFDLMNGKI